MITAVASLLRNTLFAGASERALTTLGVAKPSDIYEAIADLPDLNLGTVSAAAKRGMEYMYAHNTLQSTFKALVEKTIATYNLFYESIETGWATTRVLQFTTGRAFAHIKQIAKNYNYEALLSDSSFGRLATIGFIYSLLSKRQEDHPNRRSYLRQAVNSLLPLGLAGAATLALCSKTSIFGNRQVTPLDIANDLGSIILFSIGRKVFARSLKAVAWTISDEKHSSNRSLTNILAQNGTELADRISNNRSYTNEHLQDIYTRIDNMGDRIKKNREYTNTRLQNASTNFDEINTRIGLLARALNFNTNTANESCRDILEQIVALRTRFDRELEATNNSIGLLTNTVNGNVSVRSEQRLDILEQIVALQARLERLEARERSATSPADGRSNPGSPPAYSV